MTPEEKQKKIIGYNQAICELQKVESKLEEECTRKCDEIQERISELTRLGNELGG